MIYTIYEPATGHITNILHAVSTDDLDNHLGSRMAIEGQYDSNEYYIQNQIPVTKSPKPGDEYEYNYIDHTWQINTIYLMKHGRIKRNQMLVEIDNISPVRYASLTAEQQAELQQYRQLLLDVPQQSDFPITIDWPVKPAWLR